MAGGRDRGRRRPGDQAGGDQHRLSMTGSERRLRRRQTPQQVPSTVRPGLAGRQPARRHALLQPCDGSQHRGVSILGIQVTQRGFDRFVQRLHRQAIDRDRGLGALPLSPAGPLGHHGTFSRDCSALRRPTAKECSCSTRLM